MAGWAERVAFTSGIGLFLSERPSPGQSRHAGVCPQQYPVRHAETIRPVSRRGRFTPPGREKAAPTRCATNAHD